MIDPVIIALLILGGIGYAMLIILLQHKLTNMRQVYKLQNTMKEKQKNLTALTKMENVAKADLEAAQKEIMQLASESMKHQMKPMLIIFPISLIVFYYVLPLVPGIATPPFIPIVHLSYYQGLFVLVGAIFNVLLTRIIMKRLTKDDVAQPAPAAIQQQ